MDSCRITRCQEGRLSPFDIEWLMTSMTVEPDPVRTGAIQLEHATKGPGPDLQNGERILITGLAWTSLQV